MPIPLNLKPISEINPSTGFISQMLIAETNDIRTPAPGIPQDGYYYLGGLTDLAASEGGARTVAATQNGDFGRLLDGFAQIGSAGPFLGVAKKAVNEGTIVEGFHAVQPLGVDFNIMDSGETIPVPYFVGNAGDTKDAAGETDVIGSTLFSASADGDETIFANLMQSLNPDHVKRTGIGVGSGAIATAASPLVAQATLGTTAEVNHTIITAGASPVNPTRVLITFDANAAVAAGGTGVIEVEGTCLSGYGPESYTTLKEEFFFKTGGTTTFYTDVHYKTITSIKSRGFSAGQITVTILDTAEVVTFTSQDNLLRRFWIMEVAKGTILNVYTGVLATGLDFEFSRGNTAIQYTVPLKGRRGFLYRDLNGRDKASAIKTDASNLVAASTEIMTGWQAELILGGSLIGNIIVGGVRAPVRTATFSCNQNFDNTGAVTGVPWEDVKPYRQRRNVTITSEAIATPENDYSRIFKNNSSYAAAININHYPFGGMAWRKSFILKNAQLTVLPEIETPEGLLVQPLSMKSFVSGIGLAIPDDLRIVCDYSAYSPVVNLAA